MQDFAIREAKDSDLPTLARLIAEHAQWESSSLPHSMETASAQQNLKRLFFDSNSKLYCLVVETGDQVVGYATAAKQTSTWLATHYLYIDCLYLSEVARGQGVGRLMMQQLNRKAKELGCRHLEWQTPEFNQEAIGFYQKLGAVAKRKQRFHWDVEGWEPGEHRLVATAHSLDTPDERLEDLNSSSPIRALPAEALLEPYQPRSTRIIDVRSVEGWKLKVYQIVRDESEIPGSIVDIGLNHVQSQVPWPPHSDNKKCGFVILHAGQQALWLLIHLWLDDILRQFVFCAPVDDWTQFSASPMDGFNACVWELEVTRHERDAWVKHVLSKPQIADYESYLGDALSIQPASNHADSFADRAP